MSCDTAVTSNVGLPGAVPDEPCACHKVVTRGAKRREVRGHLLTSSLHISDSQGTYRPAETATYGL
ncbi:hypothetical protein JCM12141A_06110 [Mycolicibacterium hodleri]